LDEPFLLMIAGPNGAGKTTLVRWLRQRGIGFGEYINPDDIAQELNGSYDARVREAQSIADRRREACIQSRRSFSFETVMSHPSKVDILLRAKQAGFFVQLFFIGTEDPQISADRVALRVAQGGHDVPRDRIAPRWFRTMNQLFSAIEQSDRAFVFDNTPAGVDVGRRLVFIRDAAAKPPLIQSLAPIPEWVRRYVLEPP
jgi:predicted ABC-type ATPase